MAAGVDSTFARATAILRPAALLLVAGCGARSMLDLGATAFGAPDGAPIASAGADGGGVSPGVGPSQPPDAGAGVEPDGAAVAQPEAGTVVQSDGAVAPTGACSGGVVKLATTASFPSEVATDGAYVYWNDQTGLMSVPIIGGAAQQLAAFVPGRWPDLSAFALSTVTVYFGRALMDDVANVSKGGGAVLPVVGLPALGSPEVAAGMGNVYAWSFGSNTPDRLYAIPSAGPVGSFDLSGLLVEALAVDGGRAYAASATGVQVIDLAGGGVTTLTSTPALAVATDATDVYFSALPETSSSLGLGRVPKGGGSVTPLVKPGRIGTAGIVATGSDVYFADRDLSALRKIVGKDPARIVTVAAFATGEQPIGVALDGQCVYVAVDGSGGSSAGAIYAAPL